MSCYLCEILFFAETLYCLLPPHEKNVMIIKNEMVNEKSKENISQLFPKQVRLHLKCGKSFKYVTF